MANEKSSLTKAYIKTAKHEYERLKKDVKNLGNILKADWGIGKGKPSSKSLKDALKVGIKETTKGKLPSKQQRKIPKDITKRSPVIRKVPTRKKSSK